MLAVEGAPKITHRISRRDLSCLPRHSREVQRRRVLNRGDQRENIFKDDQDRKKFLGTLGEACAKTEWQVHAYCLMRNHFHLVIETPQANLVAGMKWLSGVYTKRFNPNAPMQGPPTSSTVLVNLGMSIEPAAHGLPLRTESEARLLPAMSPTFTIANA